MIRSTFRTTFTILLAGTLALFLAACGGGEAPEGDSAESESGGATTEQSADVDREITLQPEGNQMKYATTELTVEAGETVRLVFENIAESPSMVHNVLILNTDDEEVVERVGTAGQSAGQSEGYVPDDDAIIAHTPLAQPGETVEVTFTAPEEPGEYTYVCTYPGHWAMMQGTLVVEG
ncbi:hypothetical protein CRI93_05805 [Longimonas halophila]|uniref:Blue (type 1) copper domain-containing protein n=1 Tax=Longimonas halophila TaxID=1469170 RepID=A0A2H3NYS7_9BACT|nr:plastocyanin/azurin family copper-binding protein [Longimonas halophila]PEN07957.1 hypothetical protein CRI93_05805 [Longimonas halophila]